MKIPSVVALLSLRAVVSFNVPFSVGRKGPDVSMSLKTEVDRRDVLNTAMRTLTGFFVATNPLTTYADEVVEKKPLGPVPTDWGLSKDYYTDATKMVNHMRYCTSLEKGTTDIEKIATNCKKEMIDFVSYYRRFPNVAGKLSYSNLYTSINVLAGHYSSYGPKFPVPEKRKKRLFQEYNDIEKAIKRQR